MAREVWCTAVLFDLDGVLVDSSACIERHWRAWAERKTVDIQEILRVAHGRRTIETVALVAPGFDLEAEVAALAAAEASDVQGVVSLPGVSRLLASIPPGRWAVVTSGVLAVAEARLRHVGIAIPEVLVSADMVNRGKPDPEGYLKAAWRLGIAPSECAVVEDSPAGLEAARAARMESMAVCTTHERDQLGAAALIVGEIDHIHVEVIGERMSLWSKWSEQ